MDNSELVATLRIFSSRERERLLLFLQSPYCTGEAETEKEIVLVRYIFESLQQQVNDGALSIESEMVYDLLFPGKSFRRQTIHNLTTSTLKLVRRFMEAEVSARTKRPVQEYTAILQFISEKGDIELCNKYINRLDRSRNPEENWDDFDFYLNWRAEVTRSQFLGVHNQMTDDYNLRESLTALEKFYLTERFNSLSALFNQNRLTPILSPEERQAYIDELERWSDRPFFHHPLALLYRKVLLFFHQDGESAEQTFQSFMELLTLHEKKLSLYHLKRLEAFAYNFCARRFSNEKYRNILFDLFQRWIQPERLLSDETIPSSTLLSLIQTGLMSKQYAWVEKFNETYRHRVQGRQPSEEYYLFCRAMYCFHLGEFDTARNIIIRLNFHEIQYKYLAKALEIKLYYETGEEDFNLVESKLSSMAVTLHRERFMPKEKKKRYAQFVNFMMRLNRWRGQLEPDPKRLEALREDVRNAQDTA